MLLFVYGTLRRGAANHHELGDAVYVRQAVTAARYELVDMGGYPALLDRGQTAVVGELYEVGAAQLAQLDAFEDVPTLYERQTVQIDGMAVAAYVMRPELAAHAPRLPGGDWLRR